MNGCGASEIKITKIKIAIAKLALKVKGCLKLVTPLPNEPDTKTFTRSLSSIQPSPSLNSTFSFEQLHHADSYTL